METVQVKPVFNGPTMAANDLRVKHDNVVYITVCDQGHVRYVTVDGNLSPRMEPTELLVIPFEETYYWEQALHTIVAAVLATEGVRRIFNPETLSVNVVRYGSNRVEKIVPLRDSIQLNENVTEQVQQPENALESIPSVDYYRRAAGLMRVTYDDAMHRVKQLFNSPSVHSDRQEDHSSFFWQVHFDNEVEPEVQSRVKNDLSNKGWIVAWAQLQSNGQDLVIGMPKVA